jgi:hypothetical protein
LITIYETKEKKDQYDPLMTSSESVKGLFKQKTLQQTKFKQMNKMLYLSGLQQSVPQTNMTGPTKIEKSALFYDEMKITDIHKFSKDRLQNLGTV